MMELLLGVFPLSPSLFFDLTTLPTESCEPLLKFSQQVFRAMNHFMLELANHLL